ncbi:tripartite tricarboxylate transporter substrate binding protein [Nesterenkonia sp. MY13]|uniref:Tripartite tricarboxylate transporter substrate binding protein n=1 Tax=Nesterenkonia sedimenti TaxID=1463632 RepID=A0A7X8YDP8_9MICC|nr:tripartite tricarboxylate transporter substrate binding protein [Nesterenkonia sedimenti]NLS09685.1 tripartite tricarboxylate transporter substrate binding protein [Nesterenkonia sedimenti]
MNKTKGIASLGAVALLLAACGEDDGEYPSSDLEYIVPYDPGGGADPVGREFSTRLADELGVGATVENLPGGDETVALTDLFGGEPDGYRMSLASHTGLITQPLLNEDLAYQSVDDYSPIVRMLEVPDALFVPEDSPYETLDDFIEAARENPGEITVSAGGQLNEAMLMLLELEEQADIDLNLVAMSGGGEAGTAVLSGEVDAAGVTAAGQMGNVEDGALRPLAHVGTPEFNDSLPGAVSFEEAGYDIPFQTAYMVVAPPGIDDDVLETLEAAALEVAESDEWAEWAEENGYLPSPIAGDDLAEWLRGEEELYQEAVESAQDSDIEEG